MNGAQAALAELSPGGVARCWEEGVRFHPGGGGKPLQDLKKFKKFCQIGESGDDSHLFPEPVSGLSKIINVNVFCGQRARHGVGAQQTFVPCTWGLGRGFY